MNIISNDCTGGRIYRLCNTQYNNPFIWLNVLYDDFVYLINNYKTINFLNYTFELLPEGKHPWPNIFPKNSLLSVIHIDNKITFYYTQHLYMQEYDTLTLISDRRYVYNDIESVVRNKYEREVKRMLDANEQPIFVFHDWENKNIQSLIDSNVEYKKIIFTNKVNSFNGENINVINYADIKDNACDLDGGVMADYVVNHFNIYKKKYFITFANTTGPYSIDRIINEAMQTNKFDSCKCFTEYDFDEDFKSACGNRFETYKRGYGYWSWKPYIIKRTLDLMNDDDILIYADAGSKIVKEQQHKLNDLFQLTIKTPSGIVVPTKMMQHNRTEQMWTRYDLYDYINKTFNTNNKDIYYNTPQIQSGLIILRKTSDSIKFVNNWLDTMINHFELVNDNPSSMPNAYNFVENRHDQSVLSMLLKCMDNVCILDTYGEYGEDGPGPIYAARLKK